MTETSAKEEYLCTKKSAVYFHNDSDIHTFQKAYVKISKMYDQTRRHINIYRF